MLLTVSLVCAVWIVFQDAPLWFHHCPKHWRTKHVMKCVHRMKDDEMRKRFKIFIVNGMNNKKFSQEGHEFSRRQNSIRESTIGQHTSNYVSKTGAQISAIH